MKFLRNHLFLTTLLLMVMFVSSSKPESLDFGYSETKVLGGDLFPESFSRGFISVDSDGDDLFYWLFNSRDKSKPFPPLVIWLTGGPGCASSTALLTENGPFRVSSTTKKAESNPYSWSSNADLMFIDHPINTGFSHGKFQNLPQTSADIQEYFYTFLTRFLQVHPEYKKRDLWITGESYAGHFIPAISNKIVSAQNPDINLKGVAIGNGWTSPEYHYVSYAEFAKERNLFQAPGDYERLLPLERVTQIMMKTNSPLVKSNSTPLGDWLFNEILVNKADGSIRFNYYDVTKPCVHDDGCYDMTKETDFLNSPEVMNALGGDKVYLDCVDDVYNVLTRMDWRTDAAVYLKDVLEKGIKVLAYNGDDDFICNYLSGQYWTDNLVWSGQSDFVKAEVTQLAYGTSKQFQNFQFIRFFKAGHMVPMDKPAEALQMINDFIGTPSLSKPDSIDLA